MMPELLDTAARGFAYVVSVGICVNVQDDLFVDGCYIFGRLGNKESRVVSEEALRKVEQKRIAIMLPAWKEAEVIEQMLEHNLARIDYDRDRYDIFCGTYQNDPETQARVDAAARRFDNVHKVIVPHDGPTSKADCLNWVYQGIILEERKRGQRFDILLMQDAEDIVHPLAMRLYSLLIPPNEFVQTPVFSLPLPKRSLISGTYVDEFAEHHLKDMLVREAIDGLIPSAGVGSAFARDAFEEIATAHGQQPFNVSSLTEDYEIGLKFRLAGRKTHFACRTIERRSGSGSREEFIATRELFPGSFNASVRQRSRWILGISLQTWAQIGWQGTLPVLYCLWRDRKVVVTNSLLLSGYLLVLYAVLRTAVAQATGHAWSFEAVVHRDSPLMWLLTANIIFAAWRFAMKARFVGRLYGVGHALLSTPRLILGNVIGILATLRAVRQYTAHRFSGKPLRWLKTAHEFPAFERLASTRRRLGEYLLELGALSEADLDEALSLQRMSGGRLGDVLATCGLVSQHAVTEALGRQLDLATAVLNPREIALPLLHRLPERLAEELDVLPLEERAGTVIVAVAEPLEKAPCERLSSALGARIEMRLAPRKMLRRARDRAYRRFVSELPPPPVPPETEATAEQADGRALMRLGLGFCAFHGIVPMRTPPGTAPRVLCAAPLHGLVSAAIAHRLDATPTFKMATPASVRLALATLQGSMPRGVDELGLFGLDAVEWLALKAELPGRLDVVGHVRDALEKGLSPLDYLEETQAAGASVLARARARAFGLSLSIQGGASALGLLPPWLVSTHDVTILRQDDEFVQLASPRPTPRLAHEVASLLSPLKVAWSVAPNERV